MMVGRLWKSPVGGALACALVLGAATGSVAAELRIVDGGVVDASPARRAAAASAARTANPRELLPLTQKIDLDGEEFFYSGPLEFDWTSDTVSVLVYMEPRPSDGLILTGIDDRRPERPFSGDGPMASFVIPGTDVPVATGSYGFEIAATVDAAEVIFLRRLGPQPTGGTVDVNLFVLDGSGMDRAALEQAAGLFAQVFAEARIRMGTLTLITVTGAEDLLSVPGTTEASSLLRQVPPLSNLASNPTACNIFFVREITADDGNGLYGISMGIPAALTIPGTISSGVIVNVSAHQTADGFDTRELGQTITHETGHSLGLYHTSEADGSLHDPISDTAECAGESPLAAEGCADGANFMFWSGRDFHITPGQAYVMLRSPVVR
jgi:hypothetical protein